MHKKPQIYIPFSIIGTILAILLIYWLVIGRFVESTDNAYVKGDIIQISPKVLGYVASVEVLQNQKVSAGDILVKINSESLLPKTKEAEAFLNTQKASVEKLNKQIELQNEMIKRSSEEINSANADLIMYGKDFMRAQLLFKNKAISKEKLEISTANYGKSKAAYNQANSSYAASLKQLEVLQAALKEEEGKVAEKEAGLEAANSDLENAIIKSPADGFVGNKSVQVGSYVRPGTPLLFIVTRDNIYIEANFKETQLKRIKKGQKVTIEVDAISGHDFIGEIESISPASGATFSLLPPENATGNFTKIVQRVPVKIKVIKDKFYNRLLPGFSAIVKVNTK